MDSRLVAAAAISIAVTMFAIFSLRHRAREIGLVDQADARKRHRGRVPLVGGISFFAGTLAGLCYLGYVDRFVGSMMVSAVLLVVAGAIDDLRGLDAKTRLAIEACAAALVILATGVYVDHLGVLPGIGELRLGLLGIPFTIVAVVGLINAFNMLDGSDGLAAGAAMVSIAAVLLFDQGSGAKPGSLWMLQVLFAALIPYFCANLGWPDGRKIFMGDAGSMLIGFFLACCLVQLSARGVQRLAPVDVLWCVALPVIDTVAVAWRRMRSGHSPFQADRSHLHHLLLDAGLRDRAVLALVVGACVLLAGIGYALRGAPDWISGAAFVAILLLHAALTRRLVERHRIAAHDAATGEGMAAGDASVQRMLDERIPEQRLAIAGDVVAETLQAAIARIADDELLVHGFARRYPFAGNGRPLLLAIARDVEAVAAWPALAQALHAVARGRPEIEVACPTSVFGREPGARPGNLHAYDAPDFLASVYLLNAASAVLALDGIANEACSLLTTVMVADHDADAVDLAMRLIALVEGCGANPAAPATHDGDARAIEALAGLRSAESDLETRLRSAGSAATAQVAVQRLR